METMVEDDLRYLENIEDRLAVEASVLSDKLEGFMYSIVAIRKEIPAPFSLLFTAFRCSTRA